MNDNSEKDEPYMFISQVQGELVILCLCFNHE